MGYPPFWDEDQHKLYQQIKAGAYDVSVLGVCVCVRCASVKGAVQEFAKQFFKVYRFQLIAVPKLLILLGASLTHCRGV